MGSSSLARDRVSALGVTKSYQPDQEVQCLDVVIYVRIMDLFFWVTCEFVCVLATWVWGTQSFWNRNFSAEVACQPWAPFKPEGHLSLLILVPQRLNAPPIFDWLIKLCQFRNNYEKMIAYGERCRICDLRRRRFSFGTRDPSRSLKSFCTAEFY